MTEYHPKLKLRKGKQNSNIVRTEYHVKHKERQKQSTSHFRSNVYMVDSFQPKNLSTNNNNQKSRPIDIKFIPMSRLQAAKKLITEPENMKRLNKSEKSAADRLFHQEPIKKKVDKTLNDVQITSRQLIGKDRYAFDGQIGNGTFGTVFQARDKKTLETVAIKKVFQDKKYKNRELQILKIIDHPNILRMRDSYFTTEKDKQYLNVVMDHFSMNLYELIGKYSRKTQFPKLLIKLLAYQMFRGLMYLDFQGIAHRDIKPQNILVNQATWKLVICDFGSAKILKKGEPNIAYICSRSYRAPQLIFGCTQYTPQIDMWSAACVLTQMITVQPIFRAKSSSDHLIEVIKIFGNPSKQEIMNMNPQCDINQFRFPNIPAKDLAKVLGNNSYGDQFIDLLKNVFKYDPHERLTPFQALQHQFFDQLRDQNIYRKLKKEYPDLDLFGFSRTKEKNMRNIAQLIPKWYR